jgi:hypothetical protein
MICACDKKKLKKGMLVRGCGCGAVVNIAFLQEW